MKLLLSALAAQLDRQWQGEDILLTGVGTLENAGPEDISFLANARYAHLLSSTRAGAVIVRPEDASSVRSALISNNPYMDFAHILHIVCPVQGTQEGISQEAFVDPLAHIDSSATVYPQAFIASGVRIAAGARIFPGCYIGEDCVIGENSTLFPHVTLMSGTVIGQDVTIHAGSVLGCDGFGYVNTPQGHIKIPQVGNVVVEDAVEIGANVCIDRAAMEKTVIGRGTKIDNLVQIAHNVTLGEHCIVVSQVGVSGSVRIGNNVVLAGQAGLAQHLTIGDNVVVGPRSGVGKSIPADQTVIGTPPMEPGTFLRYMTLTPKIPALFKTVRKMEKQLAALTSTARKQDTGEKGEDNND